MSAPVSSDDIEGASATPAKYRPTARGVSALLFGILTGAWLVFELETSALQARLFTYFASQASYELEDGPSDEITFPAGGPFDERRGYSSIPWIVANLSERGFAVREQVRMSPEMRSLITLGVAPPYRELSAAGLVIRDTRGKALYDARRYDRVFHSYEEVPKLIADTLLFIENKELLQTENPRRNPTLEWDRLTKASVLYVASKLGLPVPREGGSTLATQLEKFRHSPDGRTASAPDKVRQIASATLKAYREGTDTTQRRHDIIVEYLNSMPLAAAAGFGEVNGLGEGLAAWFGLELNDVAFTMQDPSAPLDLRANHYAHVLALLASLPAPSALLGPRRADLEARMFAFLSLLEKDGFVDPELADEVRVTPLHFLARAPAPPVRDFIERKAENAVRADLMRMTGVNSHYALDQLDLEVDAAIDLDLQQSAIELFRNLADKDFVVRHGLHGRHLLGRSDPSKVLYGLLLYERTPAGNLLRAQVDNLDRPFDLNRGAKVELGSTAKLRTLAHYLEVIAMLHSELKSNDVVALRILTRAARDPLTSWVAEVLSKAPETDLTNLLDQALDRTYSASAGEAFFTGGGLRYFSNFDSARTIWRPTLRVALQHSINLPFVRLMRDLVRFHEARLPYDSQLVLEDTQHPVRLQMLADISENESRQALKRAYRNYHGKEPEQIIEDVVRKERRAEKRLRKLAILHYAWFPEATDVSLAIWLNRWNGPTIPADVYRMQRAYGNPELDLADYGYLASQHSLVLWAAGQLLRNPELTWEELLPRSAKARIESSQWLFKDRNVRPQNRRLSVRIERDAFARMTPYWQRLGFPFGHLVPSYATALGSSGDRPAALAGLMGIIVNDGIRAPLRNIVQLRFARGSPYETVVQPEALGGKAVLDPEVARALRETLKLVVDGGTASTLRAAFRSSTGPIEAGGKTGTGDNRRKTFNRWGDLKTSKAINRTAAFVFFIGDRFFGVMTAFVPGAEADEYSFTSKLPLTVLKLLAPAINQRLANAGELRVANAEP